jgi:RNA polymerase-binding transcription factor DksA
MPDQQTLRARLIAKRDELEERVRRIDADLRKRDEPLSADFAEQVVEQENLDALYAIESEGRLELQKVVHALARMDRGEYAVCSRCGGPSRPSASRPCITPIPVSVAPTEQGAQSMAVETLKADALSRATDAQALGFRSTAELPDVDSAMGQDRAIAAIEFGVGIQREGYNLYVAGPTGIGKRTLVDQLLARHAG